MIEIMTEQELALLNSTEFLRNNIDTYLEGFAKFYGEAKKEQIKEKFTNAIFIAYQDISELGTYIGRLETKYTQKFLDEELNKHDLLEEKNLFFHDNSSFEYKTSMLISSLSDKR